MWRSVSIRQLALAEQMAKALELFNLQRTRELELLELLLTRNHDAGAKELQQWTSLLQAVFRMQEQAFTSNIDSLGMGDDDGAVDLRRGDHGEHGDREAMGSEGTMREAGSPGLGAPPGLQPSEPHRDVSLGRRCSSNWIPRDSWQKMDPASRDLVRLDGRRRRQQGRRQRNKRCATAEQDATDTMRAHGAHPDFRWQYPCRQPWQQHGLCEQRLPQAWQRTHGGSCDYMWMTLPQLYL